MSTSSPVTNKALVLEAFDTLFNRRDYDSALKFWSPDYLQHSAHIAPGRDGLFDLVRSAPQTLRHEPGLVLAEGEYVAIARHEGKTYQTTFKVASTLDRDVEVLAK